MGYVDGFVIPVKKENIEAYRKMAEKGAEIWIEHGALDYKECVLDDSNESEWCTTFEKATQSKEGETIIFSYIVYKDRAHRDAVNAKVMADPRMKDGCNLETAPFDFKRMAYGGFQTIVEKK
ncbi:MAG: DUF1428 domain-containing protein [Alphaproteobacteria bacterium]